MFSFATYVSAGEESVVGNVIYDAVIVEPALADACGE